MNKASELFPVKFWTLMELQFLMPSLTAVSDVGDILITESNLFGMFDFQVRGDAFGLLVAIFGILREE